jgi:hypothetical protein
VPVQVERLAADVDLDEPRVQGLGASDLLDRLGGVVDVEADGAQEPVVGVEPFGGLPVVPRPRDSVAAVDAGGDARLHARRLQHGVRDAVAVEEVAGDLLGVVTAASRRWTPKGFW